MTRISKDYIKEEYLIKIYQLFFEVVSRSDSKEEFISLLDDIFSPTEKIMIAKRIRIIYLLIKKVDQATICETLKVSSSTVSKFAFIFYKNDTYIVSIIEQMLLKENVLNFLDDLFSDLLIQPSIKLGHHKMKWEHDRRKENRKILPE